MNPDLIHRLTPKLRELYASRYIWDMIKNSKFILDVGREIEQGIIVGINTTEGFESWRRRGLYVK